MKLPHILKPLLKKEKNYQRRLDKTYFFSRAQGKRSEKRSEKSRDMIIRLLQENPSLSANALAEKIGITPRVVERHISKLKADGNRRIHFINFIKMPILIVIRCGKNPFNRHTERFAKVS